MHQIENKFQKKVYEMLFVSKLLSLLFCGIIIFIQYNVHFLKNLHKYMSFSMITAMLGIGMLTLIYKIWIFSYKNNKITSKVSATDIIEIILFIGIFSILIIFSGVHTSHYKFIFLFIIIPTTMQFGINYGIGVSSICSILVLLIDYMALPRNTINIFFETDLILTGVFLLTAWSLGYYVNIEKEYRKEISQLANMDELTGVYNHRFFQEALSEKIEVSKNKKTSVALLFIDIDYFKYYNDLYGHQAGDKVLEKIGDILKNLIRKEDIVARYGGEEFAIILPNTKEEQALNIAEKIRSTIEKIEFEGEENLPNKKLTVSVGVSDFPNKAKSKEELIKASDDALYRAKFFNKNRVETYHSVLEELKKDIQQEHIDLISSVKTLISVINAKDRYTYGHTERVVIYCKMLADRLGLREEDKKILRYGAYLHDIGKIEIGKDILNKKMPLTDEEWKLLKKHPENGAEIIRAVDSLKDVIPLIFYHHERYDGNGYPKGLKGEEIPYLARILTVADSFDAMTSNRPYQSRKSFEDAIEELRRCSKSQFDPKIVDVFIEIIEKNIDKFDRMR
ncbi:diguanylate cyclase [Crassaminicella thermophila]|uniref:Diguanylate cyclase n=1 Tax=Crassaminicella thermophila TaxID=2599308 RepID=A0A5C0S997_CRATE|nr:diguanylate cyclase [Crassaminicella thermophila]QEK11245.1 diguanylate cyclase [Crassaminicella thermophila]